MTTATTTAKPVPLPHKPAGHERGDNRVSMSVTIGSTQYRCRILPTPEAGCSRTVRLTKVSDGVKRIVSRTLDGAVLCDCESATYRPATPCKHARALVALGLIEAPAIADDAPLEHQPRPVAAPAAPKSLEVPDGAIRWNPAGTRAVVAGMSGAYDFAHAAELPVWEAIPSGGFVVRSGWLSGRTFRGEVARLLLIAREQFKTRHGIE